MQNLPRKIDPSLIQEGDEIIVRWPKEQGVATTMEGRVHELRLGSSGFTHFITREGGRLMTWKVGDKSRLNVTLTHRDLVTQIPLFGMDEIRERMR
jgi:hypothetical protein